MKLESLQSLSLAVMLAGFVLSALGACGVYYFGAKSEQSRDEEKIIAGEAVDSRIVDLLAQQSALQARLASVERQATEQPVLPPALVRREGEAPSEPPPPVGEGPLVEKAESIPAPPAKRKPEPPKPLFTPPPALVVPPLFAAQESTIEPPLPAPEITPPPAPPAAPEKPPTGLRSYGFSSAQVEKVIQRLRLHPHGVVAIHVPEGHDDALKFAQALQQTFLAAEWHVPALQVVKTAREANGIVLSSGTFPPPVEVTTIFSALVTAGIQISTDLDPSQPSQAAVLFVGSKP